MFLCRRCLSLVPGLSCGGLGLGAAPAGWEGVFGATESAVAVLRRFVELLRGARDAGGVLEALDFLEAAVRARPFSAPLVNGAREVLGSLVEALEGGAGVGGLAGRVGGVVESLAGRMMAEAEGAAEVAARRLEDGDVVVTFGFSRTVVRAVERAAAMGKRLRVVVSEARPLLDGVEAARALARVGVGVTLVVDSALRFMVKDATRVLLGADAVLADGSVVARAGAGLLALAASEARVRVVVVAGSYKLYPETVYGLTVEPPALDGEIVPGELKSLGVEGYAPLFEPVAPQFVDALATERGVIAPEAVPVLIREEYGEWPPRVKRVEELFAEAREAVRRRLGGGG